MVIFGHEFPIVMEFNYNNVSIEICHSENAPRTENHSGGMFLFSEAESRTGMRVNCFSDTRGEERSNYN
jgi:hypothetical protein